MNIELKYKIELGSGKRDVKTPFNIDLKDIKQIMIDNSTSLIKRLSVYPNGLVLYFEQSPTSLLVRSNWPFEEDGNGNLIINEPQQ